MNYGHIIRGGLIVTSRGIEKQDIGILDGKIAALQPNIETSAPLETDATGKYILPGIIDVHTHPLYEDDVASLSLAAAYGGVTTLIYYAYADRDAALLPTIRKFIAEASAESVLDFGVHAGLFNPSQQADDIPEVVRLGVTSFKFFMAYAKLGRLCDDYQLMRVFDIIANVGGLGIVHAENGLAMDYLADKLQAEHRDLKRNFAALRPGILEAEAVNRAIAIAQVTGCPLYIPHMSARETVAVVAQAKKQGYTVFGETCPQYLTLTNDTLLKYGPLAKIGPPLRSTEDNRSLWQGLASGVIDTVGSDHAPKAKKQDDPFAQAGYGSPQVETMLPVMYEKGVNQGRITLPRLVQVMCENPARIFGLYPQKGTLQPGSDADLVVLDPCLPHTITHGRQHSRAHYTLYNGWEIVGTPILSLQRGSLLLDGDAVHAHKGQGVFLATRSGQITPESLGLQKQAEEA